MAFLDEVGLAELWSLIREEDAEAIKSATSSRPRTVTGTYSGSGDKTKTLTFDGEVVYLIVTGRWGYYNSPEDHYSMVLNPDSGGYGDQVASSGAVSGDITKSGNGITWAGGSAIEAGNVSGYTYHYIAFLK